MLPPKREIDFFTDDFETRTLMMAQWTTRIIRHRRTLEIPRPGEVEVFQASFLPGDPEPERPRVKARGRR